MASKKPPKKDVKGDKKKGDKEEKINYGKDLWIEEENKKAEDALEK